METNNNEFYVGETNSSEFIRSKNKIISNGNFTTVKYLNNSGLDHPHN